MHIYTCIYVYILADFPEDLLNFPEMLPLIWSSAFQKTALENLVTVTAHHNYDKMGFFKADRNTFQRLPVQNNKQFSRIYS